jgi:hypothetical protein
VKKDIHAEVWWGNLKERNHLEELGLDGMIIEMDLEGRAW